MILLEVGDFWHLSFKIGPIFEEIAFMELIEFVPDLIAAIGHLHVILF
jgi:hypothetical protein